jgi:hypothetical protein
VFEEEPNRAVLSAEVAPKLSPEVWGIGGTAHGTCAKALRCSGNDHFTATTDSMAGVQDVGMVEMV